MKNSVDYSLYKCPYSHLEKERGHELHGPEGYEDAYGVWCPCGFRGPVFYLDPDGLKLEKINERRVIMNQERVVAVFNLELNVDCPKCGEYFDVMETGEYLSGDPIDVGNEDDIDWEATCPECGHEFIINDVHF